MTTVTVETPTEELPVELSPEQLAANAAENAVTAAEAAISLANVQAAETVTEVKEDIRALEGSSEWMKEQITGLIGAVQTLQNSQAEMLGTLALLSVAQISEETPEPEAEPVEVITEQLPESVEEDLQAQETESERQEAEPLVVLV